MNEKIWILTYTINEYDQDGSYFLCVFKEKPSIEQLKDAIKQKDEHAVQDYLSNWRFEQLLENGIMDENEYRTYSLDEVEFGKTIVDER